MPNVLFVIGCAEVNAMHAKAAVNHTILEVINEFHSGAKDQPWLTST